MAINDKRKAQSLRYHFEHGWAGTIARTERR